MPDHHHTVNQADLAELLGVDRTRIHAWQRKGLPYLEAGKGAGNRYITALATRWHLGARIAKQLNVDAVGGLDCVALGEAAGEAMGDKSTYTDRRLVADLERCGVTDARTYPRRLSFYRGMLEGRTRRLGEA